MKSCEFEQHFVEGKKITISLHIKQVNHSLLKRLSQLTRTPISGFIDLLISEVRTPLEKAIVRLENDQCTEQEKELLVQNIANKVVNSELIKENELMD